MKGIQYIEHAEEDKRYAVVDLEMWQKLFNYFLEEVEDTIIYDENIGEEVDREQLLHILKEKLQNTKLSYSKNGHYKNGVVL